MKLITVYTIVDRLKMNGSCARKGIRELVKQGKIVEVCAEPGQYTYDTSSEPSIFSGNLGESIKESFRTLGKRFTFGGDTAKDQRVYYFNTKELIDNKFGTQNPIQFKTYDRDTNFSLSLGIRCNGTYS